MSWEYSENILVQNSAGKVLADMWIIEIIIGIGNLCAFILNPVAVYRARR